jgi:hypothetical protein
MGRRHLAEIVDEVGNAWRDATTLKQLKKDEGFTLIELADRRREYRHYRRPLPLPGLLRARQSGNEASAIGSVPARSTVVKRRFASSCGGGGYAQSKR